MKEKMSRWGIGPVFVFLSVSYGMIMFVLTYFFYPFFQITVVPYPLMAGLGICLIVIGIPFFVISAVTVMRAYNADRLVTDGIFRYCRHPLYASWVVFLVPGMVLPVNSWLGLTVPVFMFSILRILVRKEEKYLEDVFGSEYLAYKKRVPCILPYGVMKQKV
ncbi:MAG: isoprenylcysteine carboxylmethyltransferase family protein [Desulfococcaceae bacterium]